MCITLCCIRRKHCDDYRINCKLEWISYKLSAVALLYCVLLLGWISLIFMWRFALNMNSPTKRLINSACASNASGGPEGVKWIMDGCWPLLPGTCKVVFDWKGRGLIIFPPKLLSLTVKVMPKYYRRMSYFYSPGTWCFIPLLIKIHCDCASAGDR